MYLFATGTWFAAHGIQNVLFAWLVTMVLRESPVMVGVAQMALLIPATIFMLVGGGLSDRIGGKRIATVAQSLAVLPSLFLAVSLYLDQLSFGLMVGYAICLGTLQAFVTPARDSLLNSVARGNVQRTVSKVTLIQFTVQIGGFILAGSADAIGGAIIVFIQALVLLTGAIVIGRLPIEIHKTRRETNFLSDITVSIVEGFHTVWQDRSMRLVLIQNVAMGICFMGSYIVTIPLLIREVYGGSSADLALVNLVNACGLVSTLVLLLMTKGIRQRRNALFASHALGALVLAAAGLVTSFYAFITLMFFWGACGGIAFSMSRTIMQERAPIDQRGRVMGFFSFSFMGAGPIGAIVWGATVEYLGPRISLTIACMCMFMIILCVVLVSRMPSWHRELAANAP